jgi:two-component system chemotaxis response regulator CheB
VIRVLIVDDSMTAQRTLSGALSGQRDIEVVGQAATGVEAVALAQKLKPTLITMDIRMPDMDGLTATEQIMALCPTRIVIVSSEVGASDQNLTFRALNAGALEVLPKPRLAAQRGLSFGEFESELVSTVRAMAEVPVVRRRHGHTVHGARHAARLAPPARPFRVLAIGASTGGPQIIGQVCAQLPPVLRLPILLVQHMSPGFTAGFAHWLDQESPLRVKLAEDGEPLRDGSVYVAPDGLHLRVTRESRLTLGDDPPVGHFRPAVDVLFQSLAANLGAGAIGLLMTGMGTDGAEGLLAMRRAGAWTLAQDADSCVVNGMPAAAKKLDAVDAFVSPSDLPGLLVAAANSLHHA